MSPEIWQSVKFILDETLKLQPSDREVYLQEACAADKEILAEVKALLAFENEGADFMEKPIMTAFFPDENILEGQKIGRYKIIREIASGGMGSVFEAVRDDGEFQQKVAVKLIKNGLAPDSLRRRFYLERQILAQLEHSYIAHLIDGGTTENGLPFLVMEFVAGVPIDEFCRKEKMSVREKLELFCKVAATVTFAHQKLVVHRDLKPANILVTANGTPKLLDFGIARILENEGSLTQTNAQALTPQYASPEQIRGEIIGTASDVYSLGVILYELLTEKSPYSVKSKNPLELASAITATVPHLPSLNTEIKEIKAELRGDLDCILLKSLQKDATRRYASVEQFANDVQRHLRGLPVIARPDSVGYRARKFIGRNKIASGISAALAVSLIFGILATAWQARIARIEREKAERRFNDVRTLANSFMFEINEEIERSPIKARELLVQRSVEYLDKLTLEAENDTELQSELATAYEKIGDVQSELFKPSLGKISDALASHQKSLEIREKLFAVAPDNIRRGLDVAKSRQFVGDIFSMSGRVAEARVNYRQTVETCFSLLVLDTENIAVKRSLASGYARLGQSILRSGALGEALGNYEEARKIYEHLAAANPDDKETQRSLSIIYSYIGYVKIETGEMGEAIRFFDESLALTEKTADANNLQSRADLSIAQVWIGVALSERGEHEKSLLHLQKALELQQTVFASDKNNFGERNGLADCYLELGRAAVKTENNDEAIKNLNQAIENYEAVWQIDRQNFSARRQIAFSQIYLANAFRQKGDLIKATEIYEKSQKILQELIKIDPNNTEWQHDLAVCHLRIGEILSNKNDKITALKYVETAKLTLEKLVQQSPEHAKRRNDLESAEKLLTKISKN
jgi:eukaryotic-like serine/threonine-protein kinase